MTQSAERCRIIDCHAHFGRFAQTRIGCPDAKSMIRAMDLAGVEKICISSFLGIGPDSIKGNDQVAEAVRRYPGRMVGYATVNPNRPEEIEPELARAFDSLGLRAIKLHPVFHRYPAEGPAYRKAVEFAARRGAIILSHEWGRAEYLGELCRAYPNASFIIAHVAFWDGRSPLPYRQALENCTNLYIDLVYSNIFHSAVEDLVAMLGPRKILWGSDFPLHDLAYQLGRMVYARLEGAAKRAILGENMLRILREAS